ncbi:alpha/beta hydrolase [Caldimonas tepidiphila]|uniref:alpha/beta hydrolase n=1 Tax=Caldimonas tepidiphila TaxID=2315841 RepID=UPI000E5AAE2D|nr:alpha/beta hydrolase [Caldimonas tepidiphila]
MDEAADRGGAALPAAPAALFLHGLDQLRRCIGAGLDLASFAPLETPCTTLIETTGLRLRRYLPDDGDGPVLLIVPAPIKRHWIWDPAPAASVVRHALQRGCVVHLLEWTSAPAHWGLEEALAAIGACVDEIARRTGSTPHLLGHSLGGTLAALHAARRPEDLASLVLVEAPVRFGADAGAFAPLLACSPPGALVGQAFGRVPGSVLNLAALLASPREFVWERHLDALAAALEGGKVARSHLLALRWTLDEFPMSGRLFAQVADGLYREDRFMRGTLAVGGQLLGAAQVRAPVAAIVDPHSEMVPARSVLALLDAAPLPRRLVLHYERDVGVGLQHLGVLIGRGAHRALWPRVFDWLEAIDRPAPD